MKPIVEDPEIPVYVSVSARAIVTAGLANPVDDVAITIAATHAPTAEGTADARSDRTSNRMRRTKTNVPIASDPAVAHVVRALSDEAISACPNVAWAAMTPATAPITCASAYGATSRAAILRSSHSATVTAGLKCDPDTIANMAMRAARPTPTAIAWMNSCVAGSDPAVWTMIPLPTMMKRSSPVPIVSAVNLRAITRGSPPVGRVVLRLTKRHRGTLSRYQRPQGLRSTSGGSRWRAEVRSRELGRTR